MNVITVKELKSHDARNFLVTTASKGSYVLKFMKESDSEDLELQYRCMDHLTKTGFLCPNPVGNIHGDLHFDYEGKNSKCVVFLLTYIPGHVAQDDIADEYVLYDIGSLIGDIQTSLKEFKPKFRPNSCNNWSIEKVPELEEFLPELNNDHQREIIRNAIGTFQNNMDKFRRLERGWIHGDLHDENIIVVEDNLPRKWFIGENHEKSPEEPTAPSINEMASHITSSHATKEESKYTSEDALNETSEETPKEMSFTETLKETSKDHPCKQTPTQVVSIEEVSIQTTSPKTAVSPILKQMYGIIDFEDIHENYCVLDILIAMAVFMMSVPTNDGKFLETSGYILAGYLSRHKLSMDEKAVMNPVILGRYAQELVLCTAQNNHQSQTNAYLTEIFQNAWPQLEFMIDRGEEYVFKVWNDVLDYKRIKTL